MELSCKQPNQPAACPRDFGTMPDCAPLAVPYVPFQQTNASKYSSQEALSQGTLFPGLNLPFHLKTVGTAVPKTPLTELQALCFVVHELGLYLDTHQDDQEAFAMFQKYSALAESCYAAYVEANGPIRQTDAAADDRYTWLDGPWPWESTAGQEVEC